MAVGDRRERASKTFLLCLVRGGGSPWNFPLSSQKEMVGGVPFIAAGLGYVYEEGGVYGMGKGSDISRPHRE